MSQAHVSQESQRERASEGREERGIYTWGLLLCHACTDDWCGCVWTMIAVPSVGGWSAARVREIAMQNGRRYMAPITQARAWRRVVSRDADGRRNPIRSIIVLCEYTKC